MIRLGPEDFAGGEWTEKLAAAAHMSVDAFKARFGHLK